PTSRRSERLCSAANAARRSRSRLRAASESSRSPKSTSAPDSRGRGMGDEPARSSDLLATRREKLGALRAAGIEPFPHEFGGVEPIADVRAAHAELAPGEETTVKHRVAGRLAARRGQGKMAFLDLVDRSGRIQLQARIDELGSEGMDLLLGLDL